MATMKDVAKEAGVALGTVSNVLNNRSSVSDENRRKVMLAIEKLNYMPNQAARTLKTRSTKTIGLVIPSIVNPYYPELARGVEDNVSKNGYTMLLCNTDRNAEKEHEYIKMLIEKNMDGIIIVKSKLDPDIIQSYCRFCPFVLVDTFDSHFDSFDTINVNEEKGIFDALELFYDYGHRKIAYISGLMDSASSKTRLETYRRFLEKKDIAIRPEYIKNGTYDWYSGYACTIDLLRSVDPPTAILASNDLMAIGAIKAITERRLRIPFDISVMGIDDIDMATLCTPQLTTLRQPKYEMGFLAVDLLMAKFGSGSEQSADAANTNTVLDEELILRESVGYV